MLEDTKWVKSVTKNPKGKGYIIQWHDDKKDIVFDTAFLKTANEALEAQRAVTYTKEKVTRGERDYWDIKTLVMTSETELVEQVNDLEQQVPVTPPRQVDEPPDKPVSPVGKRPQISERDHDIHRQVALKCAVDLASHGLIEIGELKEKSEMLLRYLDGE